MNSPSQIQPGSHYLQISRSVNGSQSVSIIGRCRKSDAAPILSLPGRRRMLVLPARNLGKPVSVPVLEIVSNGITYRISRTKNYSINAITPTLSL